MKKVGVGRCFTWILFFIYLAALTWIIVFKFQLSVSRLDHVRSVNLIPLKGSVIVNGRLSISELFMNAVIFAPFGVYAQVLLEKWPFGKKLLLMAGVSLLFETLQFAWAIGRSDITDVINNVTGGAAGLLICRGLGRLCGTKERTAAVVNVLASAGTAAMLALMGMLLWCNR